ncbi:MAG: ABC transporter ATP-binding protein [Desulfovibrio sp.]|jgi:iron complex transport system ATP-binding protein|nr:ABC transporter ATP-binding protein [Desulfovibrio sp.]
MKSVSQAHDAPLFYCQGLELGYAKQSETILTGLDFSIHAGEIVALLGPNGAGKSTLIKAMSGVVAPQAGQAWLQGSSLSDLRPREVARCCAVVPQQMEALFGLRVRTLVSMGRYSRLSFWSGPGSEDRQAVDAALEATGMTSYQERPVNRLSGGELQRVLLARALAQQAPLLLLDEPFSAMDMAWRVRCFDLLLERPHSSAVLVALHDINLAALYCNRILFLKERVIAYDGPVEPVFSEKLLSDLYETKIKIAPHPETGRPQAFPVPGARCVHPFAGGRRVPTPDEPMPGTRTGH